jgi:glycosyltransferase involved in cell wall biosynthesis
MKIIYITDQIYLHGGAEKILIQKLNYWAESGDSEVLLITTDQKGKQPFFELNVKVKVVDLAIGYTEGTSYYHPKNFIKFATHYTRLKKAIREFNPDAVFHVSLGFSRYILPLAARNYRIYNEYHTSYYGFGIGQKNLSFFARLKKRFGSSMIRLAESHYTRIVFLNQEEFDHYSRVNSVIIPNFFNEVKHEITSPRKHKAISLGRLCYQKGYDLLIDAWELVDKQVQGWTLEIYGNGEDAAQLQQKIADKNLGHTIHLNPATGQVDEKLLESSLYVMSSRFETFPMVLLEAMTHALPVVSFDCPTGPRSILTDNEDSFLVENGNIQALADKIVLLIRDEPLRTAMGENARKKVGRFSQSAVMAKWRQLLETTK